jgi:hypothetical protein
MKLPFGKKPKKVIIETQFGPTTESMRLLAISNMRADPQKLQSVQNLLIAQMGSREAGLVEFFKRFPELADADHTAKN